MGAMEELPAKVKESANKEDGLTLVQRYQKALQIGLESLDV